MRCKVCGHEAEVLSNYNVCIACEKSLMEKLLSDSSSTNEQEASHRVGHSTYDRQLSEKGSWANHLMLLSATMLLVSIIIIAFNSKPIITSQSFFLLLVFPASVMIPSIISIVLSVSAKLVEHDKSRIATRALIFGIVLTLLAIPVQVLVILYFGLSQANFGPW